MRKKVLFLLILVLALTPLFSITDSLKVFDTKEWLELEEVIKCNKERSIVDPVYSSFVQSDVTDFEKARAEYLYSRYLADNDYKDEAKEHLVYNKNYVDSMDKSNEILNLIAQIDYSSAKTYISKDYLGAGLENSNLTKEAIKKYPDEAYFIVTNGWRLIYTPQIAGGSNKNAIKGLEPILKEIDNISISNKYSAYGALATAHFNRKDYKESKEYLDLAFDIYYGEPPLLELERDLEKKLK